MREKNSSLKIIRTLALRRTLVNEACVTYVVDGIANLRPQDL
jgi:hypothetical protein